MMQRLLFTNIGRLILGTSLLVGALFGHLVLSPDSDLVSTDKFEVDVTKLDMRGWGIVDTAPLMRKERFSLSVSYPSEIRENETPIVKLVLSQQVTKWADLGTKPSEFQIAPTLNKEISARLVSAGFTIQPDGPIVKPKDSHLPAEFLWSIKPSAEGKHDIFIDLSSLPRTADNRNATKVPYSVNGQKEEFPRSGMIPLPVVVKTVWGVSAVTVFMAKGAISLLGFVLMYPVLVSYLKGRLRMVDE